MFYNRQRRHSRLENRSPEASIHGVCYYHTRSLDVGMLNKTPRIKARFPACENRLWRAPSDAPQPDEITVSTTCLYPNEDSRNISSKVVSFDWNPNRFTGEA